MEVYGEDLVLALALAGALAGMDAEHKWCILHSGNHEQSMDLD